MKPAYRVTLISLLCLLLTLFSLGFGEISLSPAETCHYLYLALTSPEGSGMVEQDVLQFIRLPHLVLSFFIGAGLAVCGAVMQAVMKNPLADPYLLGISSGASLGAVLAIALGIGMIGSFDGIGAAAFLGAGLVSLLILLISSISGKGEGLTLLLAGFALNAACSAAVSFFVTVVADTSKTRSIQFWMMGNIRADSWMAIGILALLVTAGCFYLFFIDGNRYFHLTVEVEIAHGCQFYMVLRLFYFIHFDWIGGYCLPLSTRLAYLDGEVAFQFRLPGGRVGD